MAQIDSERHHWWPKSLSQFWAGDDRCVSRLSWDGSHTRKPPASFGITPHAHNIRLKGPWAGSFEGVFGLPDGEFPRLVEWLLGLDSLVPKVRSKARLLAQPFSNERREQLAQCVASLIARSPRFRNHLRLTAEHFRKAFGMENFAADKTLIAANVHGCYETFTQTLGAGGKFMVGFSDSRELIFGDGFLSNFVSRDAPLSPRVLLPLTPSIALLFVRPLAFVSSPELVTLRLKNHEVSFINEMIQVYSKDQLFFRHQKPSISEHFAAHEFLEFTYDHHPILDSLIGEILSFRVAPRGRK
jgi:hypothetical protein